MSTSGCYSLATCPFFSRLHLSGSQIIEVDISSLRCSPHCPFRKKFLLRRKLCKKSDDPDAFVPPADYHLSAADLRRHKEAQMSFFKQYHKDIISKDPTIQLRGAIGIRNAVCEPNPPIEELIKCDVVPRLVEFLSFDKDPQLQKEAAWALTNMVSGKEEFTQYVVKQGTIPKFIQLLSSPNMQVVDQAIWALGNIAGDTVSSRDLVLQFGGLPVMLTLLEVADLDLSMRRNIVWAISNLCRFKPKPYETLTAALPTLVKQLDSTDDQVIVDSCWSLSYLSDDDTEQGAFIKAVINSGACAYLVRFLEHKNPTIQTTALRCVGNIVTGDDSDTQSALALKPLPALLKLLNHYNYTTRKEAAWTLSNIAAGPSTHIQQVLDNKIIDSIIPLARDGAIDIQTEALYALYNASAAATRAQMRVLVEKGIVEPLVVAVDPTNRVYSHHTLLSIVLNTIDNVLFKGQKNYLRRDANPPASIPVDQSTPAVDSQNPAAPKAAITIEEANAVEAAVSSSLTAEVQPISEDELCSICLTNHRDLLSACKHCDANVIDGCIAPTHAPISDDNDVNEFSYLFTESKGYDWLERCVAHENPKISQQSFKILYCYTFMTRDEQQKWFEKRGRELLKKVTTLPKENKKAKKKKQRKAKSKKKQKKEFEKELFEELEQQQQQEAEEEEEEEEPSSPPVKRAEKKAMSPERRRVKPKPAVPNKPVRLFTCVCAGDIMSNTTWVRVECNHKCVFYCHFPNCFHLIIDRSHSHFQKLQRYWSDVAANKQVPTTQLAKAYGALQTEPVTCVKSSCSGTFFSFRLGRQGKVIEECDLQAFQYAAEKEKVTEIESKEGKTNQASAPQSVAPATKKNNNKKKSSSPRTKEQKESERKVSNGQSAASFWAGFRKAESDPLQKSELHPLSPSKADPVSPSKPLSMQSQQSPLHSAFAASLIPTQIPPITQTPSPSLSHSSLLSNSLSSHAFSANLNTDELFARTTDSDLFHLPPTQQRSARADQTEQLVSSVIDSLFGGE